MYRKNKIKNNGIICVHFSLFTGLLAKPSTSGMSLGGSSLLGTSSLSTNLKLTSNLTSSLGTSSLLSSSLLTSSKLCSTASGVSSKTTKIESGLGSLSLQKKATHSTEYRRPRDKSLKRETTKISSETQRRKRVHEVIEKTEKKKKVESKSGVVTAKVIKRYTIDRPKYAIECTDRDLMEKYMEVDVPKFVDPNEDIRLVPRIGKSLTDVMGIKVIDFFFFL